jgi:hypothetical protein
MKLWLDDARAAPPGWTRANNMAEAMKFAEENVIEEMSLDHDLGPMPVCPTCELSQAYDDSPDACDNGAGDCRCGCHRELQPTGYDFVKWMCETGKWPVTKPRVHSQNPVGRANMQALIDRYWFNPQLN